MKNLENITSLPCYLIFDKDSRYNSHYKSLLSNLGFSGIYEINDRNKSFCNLYKDLCKNLKENPEYSHILILRCPFILHSQVGKIFDNIQLEINNFDCLYLGGIFPFTKYKARYFSNIEHVRIFNSNRNFCSDISLINSSGLLLVNFLQIL